MIVVSLPVCKPAPDTHSQVIIVLPTTVLYKPNNTASSGGEMLYTFKKLLTFNKQTFTKLRLQPIPKLQN